MAIWYRIVQEKWAATAMDGEGARRFGGRWNPVGLAAVYLAESRALAALEIMVHAPRAMLQLEWRVIEVDVPDRLIETAATRKLPGGWRDQPSSLAAQRFGGDWLRTAKGVALVLPSVIIPEERALLLNPSHPEMSAIKWTKPKSFRFDERL